MARRPNESPVWKLIEVTIGIWEREYDGEKYIPSGKDFKHGKEFLNVNDFVPDEIIRRYEVFILKDSIYAERRHQFSDFIRNIGSFVPPKQQRVAIKKYTCKQCGEIMPEQAQYGHNCAAIKPTGEAIQTLQSAFRIPDPERDKREANDSEARERIRQARK